MSRPNVRVVNVENEAIANADAGAGQELTVGVAEVALSAFQATSTHVFLDVISQPVRVRFDGTAPTATVGHYLAAGTHKFWKKELAASATFIRDTTATGDATVFVTELKQP